MKGTHRAKDISESAPSTPEAPPPAKAPAARGRPGRRSVEERRHAVLELISGKAGIDQLAQQFGVLPSTIEAWRDEALDGITEALRRGTAKSPRETAGERRPARGAGRVDDEGHAPAASGGDPRGPAYSAREVSAMSRETPAGEAPVALLCETFGLSRAAYYASRKAPANRSEKVVRLPARPRHTPAEDVLAAIREVIAEQPAWGVRKVWATLRRRDLCVSRKRVWALMRANGLVPRRDREPGEATRGHVAVPEPNRRWATDMTTVWTKREGPVAVSPVIDCGCRSLLACRVTKAQDSLSGLAPVAAALSAVFGAPVNVPAGLELRTDHGPEYTGGDAANLAVRWNVEHTFAPVGRPTGNAVAERVIRTIKEELLWLQDWEDAAQIEAAIVAYLPRYNHERPHQALDWKTSAEYRAEKLGGAGTISKAA